MRKLQNVLIYLRMFHEWGPLCGGILVSSKLKMNNLLYFSTKIQEIVLYLANHPKWSILKLSACAAWVKSHKYV